MCARRDLVVITLTRLDSEEIIEHLRVLLDHLSDAWIRHSELLEEALGGFRVLLQRIAELLNLGTIPDSIKVDAS